MCLAGHAGNCWRKHCSDLEGDAGEGQQLSLLDSRKARLAQEIDSQAVGMLARDGGATSEQDYRRLMSLGYSLPPPLLLLPPMSL